jgi:hypothetical protein
MIDLAVDYADNIKATAAGSCRGTRVYRAVYRYIDFPWPFDPTDRTRKKHGILYSTRRYLMLYGRIAGHIYPPPQ